MVKVLDGLRIDFLLCTYTVKTEVWKTYQKVWNTYHIPYIPMVCKMSYQMRYVMHTVNLDAT